MSLPKATTSTSLLAILKALDKSIRAAAEAHRKLEASHRRCAKLADQAVRTAKRAGSKRTIASQSAELEQMRKLQMAMQRENTMFTSISNVLKSKHDTAKNAIGNIR